MEKGGEEVLAAVGELGYREGYEMEMLVFGEG